MKIKTPIKPKLIKKNISSSKSSSNTEDDDESPSSSKFVKKQKQRTVESKTEFKDLVVRKRMASLNATAMLAASYEVERHLDRCDSMYNSSSPESQSEAPSSPKKLKDIKHEIIDEVKEVKEYQQSVLTNNLTIFIILFHRQHGQSQQMLSLFKIQMLL